MSISRTPNALPRGHNTATVRADRSAGVASLMHELSLRAPSIRAWHLPEIRGVGANVGPASSNPLLDIAIICIQCEALSQRGQSAHEPCFG